MIEEFRELAWDDEISEESSFILLPEGDYTFTVKSFERARFNGSEKMPPCNMAKVTFTIHGVDGDADVTENFLLCNRMEWKLSALFLSLGLKKHGEPLRMNWNAVPKSTGKCHIFVDTYVKKDGSQGQSNKIKKFYAYDEAVQTLSPQKSLQHTGYNQGAKWKAGQF